MARYALFSTMESNRELQKALSRHNTLKGADDAQDRLNRAVKRGSGPGAYHPTAIRQADGSDLTDADREELERVRADKW